MLDVTVHQVANTGFPWSSLFQLLGTVLPLLGVILTIAYTGRRQKESLDKTAQLQRDVDDRRRKESLDLKAETRREEVRVARGVVFAQLSRVYRTIQGEYEYLASSGMEFIWLSHFVTLVPTGDSIRRIELLTAEEVIDITAFFYSYQENMGYITGLTEGFGKSSLKLDMQMVGVKYHAGDMELKWLFDALRAIERKAFGAMDAILGAALREYGKNDLFYARLNSESDANKKAAERGAAHCKTLEQRTAS